MMSCNPEQQGGRIADYLPLIQAANGLTLGQICSLSGLGSSAIQNWIKRGYVPHPVGKKYTERHLARILLIARLRESMQIDRVGALLTYINGDADDESDDVISETALYDLFCEIVGELRQEKCTCFSAGERVSELIVRRIGPDAEQKLIDAVRIMALTYMANCWKQEAERLYAIHIEGVENG